MKTETDKTGQLKIRVPLELRTWLQQQASSTRRSLNGEILIRLEQSRNHQLAQPQGVTA